MTCVSRNRLLQSPCIHFDVGSGGATAATIFHSMDSLQCLLLYIRFVYIPCVLLLMPHDSINMQKQLALRLRTRISLIRCVYFKPSVQIIAVLSSLLFNFQITTTKIAPASKIALMTFIDKKKFEHFKNICTACIYREHHNTINYKKMSSLRVQRVNRS